MAGKVHAYCDITTTVTLRVCDNGACLAWSRSFQPNRPICFDSAQAYLYSVHAMNAQPQNNGHDKQSQLTLELLQAIDQKDDISQRDLAQGMGVALGLANSYLKRCVKKGWIKITTAPANRYFYYLTPNGFAEKARLTADFFTTSLTLFRQSGEVYSELFKQCELSSQKRILLVGVSDLTEIALMRATQAAVEIIAIYQPQSDKDHFFGIPIVDDLPAAATFDCAVLTSMEQTTDLLTQLEQTIDSDKIIVPSLLLNMSYRSGDLAAQVDSQSATSKSGVA